MKNKFTVTSALLLIAVMFAGCYTQLGYYEAPPITRQKAYKQQKEEKATKREQTQQTPAESQGETESKEEEGYYGRHKPIYEEYPPYYDNGYIYDNYYLIPYEPYPYGNFYSPFYPYDGYYGYYYYDGYYEPYYYPHYRGYSHNYYRNGDLYHGRQRSESYRGVDSPQPPLERPKQSRMTNESNRAPTSNSSRSSDLQHHRLRRSERRH